MTSKLNVIAREPVLVAALASIIVWIAAKYGVKVDAQQASEAAGVVLLVAGAFARQLVTPTVKVPTVQGNTSNSGAQVVYYPTAEGEIAKDQPPPPDPVKPSRGL